MKNETAFKKWVKENRPNNVWWWNIPTQAGRAGIQLPFDSICCVYGMCVAIEFKWQRWDIKAHQALALGTVEHAGGLGLLVCGFTSENGSPIKVKVITYPFLESKRKNERITLGQVWPHILEKVERRLLT